MDSTENVSIPVGDGKASVSSTRGMKHWFSTKDEGLTVESTVTVQLTCGQSKEEIFEAALVAGRLADGIATGGMADMYENHLLPFQKGISPRSNQTPIFSSEHKSELLQVHKQEEPIRRSEKKHMNYFKRGV